MHPYFGENEADYPLHAAAASGTLEDIKQALNDPDQTEKRLFQDGIFGESPLHWAAARGDMMAARLLLEEGVCYANHPDRHFELPATVAKRFNHPEMAEFLKKEAYLECERGCAQKEKRWRAQHRKDGRGDHDEGRSR